MVSITASFNLYFVIINECSSDKLTSVVQKGHEHLIFFKCDII